MTKIMIRLGIVFLLIGIYAETFAQVPAPVKLTASYKSSAAMSAVTLTWEKAAAGDVMFNVYKKEGALTAAGEFKKIAPGVKERGYMDLAVQNGKTYSYYVTAYTNTAESEPSNKVEVTITVPVVQVGYIAGTLSNEQTKAPIFGGVITFIPKSMGTTAAPDGQYVVKTDNDGKFKAELKTGEYVVLSAAPNYKAEYYDNVKIITEAKTVKVNQGETVTIAVALTPETPPVIEKGVINGVLTDEATTKPIVGGMISFIPKPAISGNMTVEGGLVVKTNDKGEFVAELKTGDYYIQASAAKYKMEFYDNVYSRNDAKAVTVAKGATTTISIALTPEIPVVIAKGVIKGVITDEVSKAPVKGGVVYFTPRGTILSCIFCAKTDESGKFSIELPAGSYLMKSYAPQYKAEFFDNVYEEAKATIIQLKLGDTLSYSVALTPETPLVTYTISGTVKTSAGAPVSALVRLFKTNKKIYEVSAVNMSTVRTDDQGNYSLKALQNDTVVVYAEPLDKFYVPKYYNDKATFQEATRIVVTADVKDVNFVFTPKPVYNNSISGKVVDSTGAVVISNVTALNLSISSKEPGKFSVMTDDKGLYSLKNLVPGKYLLMVVPKPGYMPGYYKKDGTTTIRRNLADTIVITETTVMANVNFVVAKMFIKGQGHFAGSVKDNNGNKLNGVMIYALNSFGEVVSYDISDESGNYSMDDLNSDSYSVISDMLNYSSNSVPNVVVDENTADFPYVQITMSPDKVTSVKTTENIPAAYELKQNYPNPFNPSTMIKYQVPAAGFVSLKVYDIIGNEVAVLVNQNKQAGEYSVNFNASKLSSGIYFYQMKAGKITLTKKLMLLK